MNIFSPFFVGKKILGNSYGRYLELLQIKLGISKQGKHIVYHMHGSGTMHCKDGDWSQLPPI